MPESTGVGRRKSGSRNFLFVVSVAVALTVASCGSPPEAEPEQPVDIGTTTSAAPTTTSTTSAPPTTSAVPTSVPPAPPKPKPVPVPAPKPKPVPKPAPPPPAPKPAPRGNCDASYPTVCIPPAPPDLDCGEVPYNNFQVVGADPHGFDGNDNDGVGCEEG